MIRITSLQQLKAWNAAPTAEKPILLEWFLDYFFDLLDAYNAMEALDALEQFVVFTEKCESLSRDAAQDRVLETLNYYAGYAGTRWPDQLRMLLATVPWTNRSEAR